MVDVSPNFGRMVRRGNIGDEVKSNSLRLRTRELCFKEVRSHFGKASDEQQRTKRLILHEF